MDDLQPLRDAVRGMIGELKNRALSGNPVIFVMVSRMYNNAKDVKTEIDNTLRVSAPLRPCVKLENNNAKVQRRDGAKNKSPRVYFTGIFGCAKNSNTS
ncbi:MAG: hypothetical protein C5S48_07430 [Candidatus Methanogaster sp.]|nr:MAG: hypothetical protein C5S48_07430 [ANME-2 cluster archaeon]